MSSLAGSKTLDSLRDAFVRAYPKHSACVLPCTATNMPAFPKVLTHCALQAGKSMASLRRLAQALKSVYQTHPVKMNVITGTWPA